MAKSDLYSNSLLPAILVAGLLTGGLWRGAPASDTGKPGESASGDKGDVAPPAGPWVSDLRPAMDGLAGALGFEVAELDTEVLAHASDTPLQKGGDPRDRQILEAMSDLRAGLGLTPDATADGFTCTGAETPLEQAAHRLGAYLLVADGNDKTRMAAARALLDEYRDWRIFRSLASHANGNRGPDAPPRYDVRFIVATVPDYVDSNSGWLADQALAAIQSGMTRSGYVFDRVKLIDWSRSPAGSAGVVSASRLHERQPGLMIFRQVDKKDTSLVRLQVVLLVLETPTAGVHQAALRNSLRFLRAWDACSGTSTRPLRVLGPSFSGSIVSLASVLGRPEITRWFPARLVITGSATADENVERMATFSNGAIYRATVQPSSALMKQMAAFLASMNADWKDGCHVALLIEGNTAYGESTATTYGERTATPGTKSHTIACGEGTGTAGTEGNAAPNLARAAAFTFPLHVAQLRSDAPVASQPGTSLLPGAIVPLNMRETSPPTDLVPVLRPQLTSPVVEATIDSIFDTIRHEKLNAVGIIATDDRDTLFLAREVKRASPDVQLFLLGTHALYLHPDYVPYLRGALVASSYSLSLANQPEIGDQLNRGRREPFPSLNSEGVFHATQALLSEDLGTAAIASTWNEDSVPYCATNGRRPCVPVAPVSINVISEDGYWRLPSAPVQSSMPAPPPPNVYPLPPLPGRVLMLAALIAVAVLAHLVVLYLIRRAQRNDSTSRAFLELPFVRVLAPPQTIKSAARYHRLALTICFVLLALVAAWTAAFTLPFSASGSLPPFPVRIASALVFGGMVAAAIKLYQPAAPLVENDPESRQTNDAADREGTATRRRVSLCTATGWILLGAMVTTMGLFAAVTWQLLVDGAEPARKSIVLARVVGAGILSPVALTISLIAAIYTAVLTGVRRLSLIGRGYKQLSWKSRAFALLTGAPPAAAETPYLATLLDMPAQNLPGIYPLVVLLVLGIASVSMWQISTIEGDAFSWFVRTGSWTALGLGLLLLAQGLATWNTARSHLKRLARSPIEPHFKTIAPHVPWDISLAPPRLTELVPVARMADTLVHDFRGLSLPGSDLPEGTTSRRERDDVSFSRFEAERRLGLRDGDTVADLGPLFAPPSHVETLHDEMTARPHAALIQSESWFEVWHLSDAIVSLLERTYWRRSKVDTVADPAVAAAGAAPLARLAREEFLPRWPDQLQALMGDAYGLAAESAAANTARRDGWFRRCEQLVALQMAFVLRDIVARTITCLFAAMVCLTCLTASHLLYSFNGRTSMLMIDMLAVTGAALSAVWILVDMERDHVLSRLRDTTPGRVDINWDFIKRIAVYGILPLLVVLASLFPEVGGTLFGWLEPLRKLSAL